MDAWGRCMEVTWYTVSHYSNDLQASGNNRKSREEEDCKAALSQLCRCFMKKKMYSALLFDLNDINNVYNLYVYKKKLPMLFNIALHFCSFFCWAICKAALCWQKSEIQVSWVHAIKWENKGQRQLENMGCSDKTQSILMHMETSKHVIMYVSNSHVLTHSHKMQQIIMWNPSFKHLKHLLLGVSVSITHYNTTLLKHTGIWIIHLSQVMWTQLWNLYLWCRLTSLRPCVQEEAPHSCAYTPSPGSDSHESKAAQTRQWAQLHRWYCELPQQYLSIL